jgi:hypothetical protein
VGEFARPSGVGEQAANLVCLRSARPHETLAYAMQRQHRLLLDALDRHNAHVRSRDCLADCFGIRRVILVRLDVRLDKLRRNQSDRMTHSLQLARPKVRAAARLHPDHAGGEVGEELRNVISLEHFPQDGSAMLIYTMDGKNVLRQIDANRRNLHDGRSPRSGGCFDTSTLAH